MDKVRVGRSVASFLLPPVGLITHFVIKNEKPKAAKGYLIIAGISFALMFISGIRYQIQTNIDKKYENK